MAAARRWVRTPESITSASVCLKSSYSGLQVCLGSDVTSFFQNKSFKKSLYFVGLSVIDHIHEAVWFTVYCLNLTSICVKVFTLKCK